MGILTCLWHWIYFTVSGCSRWSAGSYPLHPPQRGDGQTLRLGCGKGEAVAALAGPLNPLRVCEHLQFLSNPCSGLRWAPLTPSPPLSVRADGNAGQPLESSTVFQGLQLKSCGGYSVYQLSVYTSNLTETRRCLWSAHFIKLNFNLPPLPVFQITSS